MFCPMPIRQGACGCDDNVPECGNEVTILAERVFDCCRLKKKLKDITIRPDKLCPCDACSTPASPEGALTFLGGASACCETELCDLMISHPEGSCSGGSGSCGCGCQCDDGRRRVQGKAKIPLNLYYQDEHCHRFVGMACVTVNVDAILRMPCDAQLPPAIRVMGSAVFVNSCRCDEDSTVTLEIALFLFVTGRVLMRVSGDPVREIPSCCSGAAVGCGGNCPDRSLENLPLFPSVRTGGYVLNPQTRQPSGDAGLYPPTNSACPLKR